MDNESEKIKMLALIAEYKADSKRIRTQINQLKTLEAEQKQYTHDIITMHNDMVDEEAKIRETENEIAADLELVRKSLAEALVKEDITDEDQRIDAQCAELEEKIKQIRESMTVLEDEEALKQKIKDKQRVVAALKLEVERAEMNARQKSKANSDSSDEDNNVDDDNDDEDVGGNDRFLSFFRRNESKTTFSG